MFFLDLFDLIKNSKGCPLCGFGRKSGHIEVIDKVPKSGSDVTELGLEKLPSGLKLKSGSVKNDDETKTWGSWLMFNDFFSIKFLARELAMKLKNSSVDTIILDKFITEVVEVIKTNRLNELKGFPKKIKNQDNLQKDPAVGRLVNHLLGTGIKMGLFSATSDGKEIGEIWKYDWSKVSLTLTKEGLEFAKLRNPVFDDKKQEQVLYPEEKEWILDYLKKIDAKGYREYSILKEVYEFLKAGNNGNSDLWKWFENNEEYKDYIKRRSKKASNDEKAFQRQLHNYARSFASAKISLLRELGLVKDKRNDYTIIGEL